MNVAIATPAPKSAIAEACEVMSEAAARVIAQDARIRDLEAALQGMVEEHEETESNTEGRYPSADSGCLECTLGTVPDDKNTGLCAYHRAKELLR